MNIKENALCVKEKVETTVFSKCLKTVEILKLCIDPKPENEFETILMDFRNKVEKCVSETAYFRERDVVFIYALCYVYEHNTESLCAVLRSLYAYHQQIKLLALPEDDRNTWIMWNQDIFLREIRQITNLHTHSKCEEMLANIGLISILHGNVGLARFLAKYGLMEFPFELNERCKGMVKLLVNGFNDSLEHLFRFAPRADTRTIIIPDELLNLMRRHSEINFKRFCLTFCTIIIISEYSLYQEEDEDYVPITCETMKDSDIPKFMCLNLFIDTTTETRITFKDIEIFIANFIDPLFPADVGKCLVENSKKMFCKHFAHYWPRSLKDLTRCTIRANLQKTTPFPQQLNQLSLPNSLKEFLLFQEEETWEELKLSHLNYIERQKMKYHLSEWRSLLAQLRNL